FEAPAPALVRLDRAHHRVLTVAEVLARVPGRRGVAAGHVAALQAQPQVHPVVATRGDAVLTLALVRYLLGTERRVLKVNTGHALSNFRSSIDSSRSISCCARRSTSSVIRPSSRANRNTSRSASSISRRSRTYARDGVSAPAAPSRSQTTLVRCSVSLCKRLTTVSGAPSAFSWR